MSNKNTDLYIFENGVQRVSTSLKKWPGKQEAGSPMQRAEIDMDIGEQVGALEALVQESGNFGVAIDLVAGDSAIPTVRIEKGQKGSEVLEPATPISPGEVLELKAAKRAGRTQTFGEGDNRKVTVEDLADAIGSGAILRVSVDDSRDN